MLQFLWLLLAFATIVGLDEAGMLTAGYTSPLVTLGGMVALLVLLWCIGILQIRLAWGLIHAERWRMLMLLGTAWTGVQFGALVAAYLLLGWGGLGHAIHIDNTPLIRVLLLGDLWLFAPALMIAAMAVNVRYWLDSSLRPGIWTAGSHFGFHFRWILAPLPLLLLIRLTDQALDAWRATDGMATLLFAMPTLEVLLQFIPLIVALTLFPVFLRLVFSSRPLPDGETRSRFVALARRMGVGFRRLLVWHTGRARVPNALVTGVAAPLRYIFLSDVILQRFPPDEQDAVFCHELGHVKHHHFQIYIAAIVGMILLVHSVVEPAVVSAGLARGFDVDTISWLLVGSVPLLILGLVLFMMTTVSQINERQADLAGATYGPDPMAIARALERINMMMGGGIRDRPSITHGSIAQRTDFIQAFAVDPAVGELFTRRARRWHGAILVVALLGVASVAWPLSSEIANYGVRSKLYAIVDRELPDGLEQKATLDELASRLDELAQVHPDDAAVLYFRARAAELQAGYALTDAAREAVLRKSRDLYAQSLAAAGPHEPLRLSARYAVDELDGTMTAQQP